MQVRKPYKEAGYVVFKCAGSEFKAVCTTGFNVDIRSNINDVLQMNGAPNGVSFFLNRALNTAPFFDYSLKYAFVGMQPVTFTIQCVLPLDPERGLASFTEPLEALSRICLPERGQSLADALSKVKAASTQASSEITKDLAGIVTEGVSNMLAFTKSTTGFDLLTEGKDVYTVVVPDQITKKCTMYYGNIDNGKASFKIESVLITGVTIGVGTPTVTTDGTKAYPSYLDVTLNCIYGRVPTSHLIKNLIQ